MNRQNIELHIEELVLHGFELKDRYTLGEAVQRELMRILTEQGIHPSVGQNYRVARIDAGAYEVKQGSKMDAIGTQVAQKVYGGLKQ